MVRGPVVLLGMALRGRYLRLNPLSEVALGVPVFSYLPEAVVDGVWKQVARGDVLPLAGLELRSLLARKLMKSGSMSL